MQTQSSYSTTVRGWLVIGDQTLELAQVGPDSCIVRESTNSPPCKAELRISVDGDVRCRPVYLPNGLSINSKTVVIASA